MTIYEMLEDALKKEAHAKYPNDGVAMHAYFDRLKAQLTKQLCRSAVQFCKPWPSTSTEFKLK